MGLEPKDFEILKKHLDEHARTYTCPVCKTAGWNVEALTADMLYLHPPDGPPTLGAGGGMIPMVTLTCSKCLYVMQFAWLGIKKASGGK